MKEALFNSDKYQYTFSNVLHKVSKDKDIAVFDVFFRKAPDNNGFAVVSGISDVFELIKTMNSDIYTYQEKYDMFYKLFNDSVFADKVAKLKFTGNISAMSDGEIAFPNQPILTLTGPFMEVQILETPILSIINHQMLIATKASRVVRAAKGIPVSSFGSRRAHGPWASIYGDKAAYIGGCSNVSNIMSGYKFDIPCTGTMSHSYIQSFGATIQSEYEAFDTFIKYNPTKTQILLIDTYDTLKSGIKHAIKAFKKNNIDDNYDGIYGVRLDSGDLAYLSKQCRIELDKAGLNKALISATNGLDEYLIKSLSEQGAMIDLYGVGDAIATSKHNPCFGGVYKIVSINNKPVIKLSEDLIKITNPGFKETIRIYQDGEAKADLTLLFNDPLWETIIKRNEFTIRDEYDKFKSTTFRPYSYGFRVLQQKFVNNGIINYNISANEARNSFLNELQFFSEEHTRLKNPHHYKVDISDALYDMKMSLIHSLKGSL